MKEMCQSNNIETINFRQAFVCVCVCVCVCIIMEKLKMLTSDL